MTYIAIIGPMGSGKTSLAWKLASRLNFSLLMDQCHTVFDWPQFRGKHADPAMAAPIQGAILENHFYQIFGHFLINKSINTVGDSGFVEHIFYNNTKHRMGKYNESMWTCLDDKHIDLNMLLPSPNITIRLKTSVEQTVTNIVNRNRHAEKHPDTIKLTEYITLLTAEYDKYRADLTVDFGISAEELAQKCINNLQIIG